MEATKTNKIENGIEELKRSFDDSAYPACFLSKYDQLECLAHSHGTETFLIGERAGGALFVAKCYDKQLYTKVTESEILPRLRHAGLPAYMESFENECSYVTVREYVEGIPLDHYAANGLSERQAVSFCMQLCDILKYLHGREHPVIHRDIKPQNIIVKRDGTIELIDFDIARQYSNDAETDTQFFGTRIYAPPEQYGFSQTDCRTDIYALGVLLRYLLTGSEEAQAGRPLSRSMKRIIDHCTAFSPKDRFASAEAVKRALKIALLKSDEQYRQRIALLLSFVPAALLFLCGGFVIGRHTSLFAPAGVVFREPLIEAAARVQLGKTDDEPITAEELKNVRALYIFGTEVAKTAEPFTRGLSEEARYTRGGITDLSDLTLMPNLEEMQISYQVLNNISAVSSLENLVNVNLMHTRVSDVSALAGKPSLQVLSLYDTNVSDVSCLDTCSRLESLELGKTLVTSLRSIGEIDTLTRLSLSGLTLDTLSGIEQYPYLQTLCLADAQIDSPDALKQLSRLKVIYANGELYQELSGIFAGTDVSVIEQ
ncbi:MAG: protein kinase [Clostridiales bacterium]|nr:protein kinase [Clostridiales bacterium]